MQKNTVYEKPTCTTCRNVSKLLIENGANFDKVNYFIDPFSRSQLQSLLKKMKIKPSELLRTKEEIYKKLKIKEKNFSEDQILELMIKHPDLVQRPIVEMEKKAVLARPAEKLNELFE